MRYALTSLAAILLVGAVATAEDDEIVTIQVQKDTPVTEFIDLIGKVTGRTILYDPNGQRLRGQTMGTAFAHRVPRSRAFDTGRSILAFYELVLVPIGPKGYEVYLAIDSRSTNVFVKNRATFVDFKQLDKYADKDGQFISCAIPIRHIENLTTLRTALSTMVTPSGIGRVHEVPGSNSIILMDFAPNVAAMAKLIRQMDVEPQGQKIETEVIRLKHGRAKEVYAVVAGLVKIAVPPPPAQRGRIPTSSPKREPRIMPYEPLNAVAVAATEEDMPLIRQLVRILDQPRETAGEVNIIRLEEANAEALARKLVAVLERAEVDDVRVAADARTNSLILAAPPQKLAAVKKIAYRLAVRANAKGT